MPALGNGEHFQIASDGQVKRITKSLSRHLAPIMPVTLQQFTERLAQSGILSAEELAGFQEGLPPEKRPQDAQDLARELIRAGRLTRFQAEAVYRGHTKGLVMGNYVVLDKIGAGGMGEVLKAHHRRMNRVVALKVLPRKAMQSPEAVKRFYREVEAAARLNHPNIVTAHDADECDGIHYLVMEFVDGQDLAHLVKGHGPLSVDEAIDCTIQVARGLAYAHGEGVIHRDIKPGNLLLDKSGTVKILDMGLARVALATEDEPERLTGTDQVMGTCDYMAPEQAEDTHAADHRADIYALGCTIYRLLVGTPPYQGDTLIKILLAHREAPIPSLRSARQDVPEALDAVCQKMLAKRPEERYQSMGEVIEALEACRTPQEAGAGVRSEGPSDSALTSFLDRLAHPQAAGAATGPTESPKAEETMPSQVVDDTNPSTPRPRAAATAPVAGSAKPAVAPRPAAPARTGLGQAEKRKLVRYIAIGGGAALCVVLLGLLIVVLRRDNSPRPPEGEGPELTAAGDKTQPPIAKAPFTAQQAKWYQQQWADYLGLPVEWENSIGMKFVLIPPGEFMMGSTEAERQRALEEAKATKDKWAIERTPTEVPHRVKITKPFYLGKYEVTQAQWEAVMGNNPSEFQDPSNPVEQVSWEDIQSFLAKLNVAGTRRVPSANRVLTASEMTYALPTEAQWEYACRAGTTTAFSFGDDAARLGQYAWFIDNSDGKTHPVGGLKPNAWGLYDVHGNVWEWCADWYAGDYYGQSPPTDPMGPMAGSRPVDRGGSWTDHPRHCRSAYRDNNMPGSRRSPLGFRVICEIPTDPAELEKFVAAIKGPGQEPKAESGKPNAGEAPDEMVTLSNGWRIGRPVNLGPVVNSSANDTYPVSSTDALALVFGSERAGGQGKIDLWVSGRSRLNGAYEKPANLGPIINSDASEGAAALSADGLTLLFGSDRSGGQGGNDLWLSTRTSPDIPFGEPINLGPIVNSSANEGCPTLTRNGSALYFSSDRVGGRGSKDLWMSSRASPTDSFGKPTNLGLAVNSAAMDYAPAVLADGLAILFASERPGGQGETDLWMSSRASLNGPFGKPINLGPIVNSSLPDGGPSVSADGLTLYFHSNRPGGQGGHDLWMARIEPPGATFSLPGKAAPPPAVAPFDEKQAKKHQQAWADYLGLPVEWENSIGMKFVLIPPGEFLMGTPEAERQWALEEAKAARDNWAMERIPTEVLHRVKITKPFYLGKYEVTQAQWEAVMGNNPSEFKNPTSPVERVSWEDVQSFLAKLNAAGTRRVPFARPARPDTEMKFALPTEAQWEYACRAGTTTAFCFGDDRAMLGQYAWFSSNSGGKTHPVGGLKPNAWGLHDIHGNVWEWCADWHAGDYYAQSPPTDPVGPMAGSRRVRRGGSWLIHPGGCRSALRADPAPGDRAGALGFRLALVVADE